VAPSPAEGGYTNPGAGLGGTPLGLALTEGLGCTWACGDICYLPPERSVFEKKPTTA
jgi:hypothetical protein